MIVFHRTSFSRKINYSFTDSFSETFEGLGIGSRLAYLDLPQRFHWVPVTGAILYGLTTPIGLAIGLGVRQSYNPGSTTASIVSGVLDSLSAGVLMYTGLVEVCFVTFSLYIVITDCSAFFCSCLRMNSFSIRK